MSDRIYEVYEGSFGSNAVIAEARERIEWLLDRISRDPVLDVGCSQGLLPVLLARKGLRVTGIDLDGDALEYARRKLAEESMETRERVHLATCDIGKNGHELGQFKTIVFALLFDDMEAGKKLLTAGLKHAEPGASVFIQVNFGRRTGSAPVGFMPSELSEMVSQHLVIEEMTFLGPRICLRGKVVADSGQPMASDDVVQIRNLEAAVREKEGELLAELTRYQNWVRKLLDEKKELLGEDDAMNSEPDWRRLAVERRRMLARNKRTITSLKDEIESLQRKMEAKQETISRLHEKLQAIRTGEGMDRDDD